MLAAMRLVPRLVVSVTVVSLAACGRDVGSSSGLWDQSAIRQAKTRGELVILMEAGFKPFTYKEDGVLKGFDVDLGRMLAEDMKVTVRFEERAFNLLANELLQRKGDLVISGVTATPERALEVSFSEPYFLTRTIALLSVPKADGVRSIRELDAPGRKIVAQSGSTGQTAAQRHLPRAELLT